MQKEKKRPKKSQKPNQNTPTTQKPAFGSVKIWF